MASPVKGSGQGSPLLRFDSAVPGRAVPVAEAHVRSVPVLVPPAVVTVRHNLPAHASTFVGRAGQAAEVAGLLGGCRLVTLAGAAGIGKTRLALQVAELAGPGYRDGVWLVELAGVGDAALVAESVLAVLPDIDRGGRGAPDLVAQLADRDVLLVLDNCEHLVSGCAELVHRLLVGCPQLSVLVTSREPLGVAGERRWWVAPLGLPGPADVDSLSVGAADAVRLFVDRAGSACPGFALGAEVSVAVAEICRRLDGLPLAIELAAARMAVLSPAEIVERLDDRFRLLTDRSPVTARRHQTLRAALEWSFELLGDAEARLLARLGVFAGGWGLRAAEQVCAGGPLAGDDVLDLLEALVAKSLVVVDRGRPVTRYRMLESVRHFAVAKLDGYDEVEAVAERHAQWCVARAERAERERRGRRHQVWLEALEEDHDNFRSALSWARENQRVDMVLALGGALSWFWETRGHLREGLEWLQWAVAREPGADGELRAKALRGAGMLSWLLGDVATAMPLVEESVALFRRAGNEEEAAGCVCSNAFHLCANPAHSLPALEANLARIRGGENFDRLAHALVNCGLAHFFVGDTVAARRCFDECLALPLGAVEAEVVAAALLGLGRVALLTGDLDGAEAGFREALDLVQLTGDSDGRSTALSWIGEVFRLRGDYPRARSLLADATELVVNGGPALSVARCRQFLGRLEASEGNMESARLSFLASLALPGATDMPYHQVRSLQGLADVAIARGERGGAKAVLGEALALAKVNGDIQAQSRALAGLAVVAGADGDGDRAAKLAHQALELQEQIGDAVGILASLETLAELAAVGGRARVAARLFGAAERARDACGCPATRAQRADRATSLELVAASLGGAGLAQGLAQGAKLSAGEAVSYATKGWGSKARPDSGWDSLTRAERDIVALVAEGLTNGEIGERLFVSARTVATHLSHIYRKLTVTTRRDLTRAAKQRAVC